MKVEHLSISELVVVEPRVFGDPRGFFAETWSARRYSDAGLPTHFVQDNIAGSAYGVLRGLHLQHPHGQGKLVSVARGQVYDVAVDVRVGSPTFGQHCSVLLDDQSLRQLYIPPGFAHGYCVLSDHAIFTYKCTSGYSPENELGIRFDDPDLAIEWPYEAEQVSEKDRAWPRLRDIPVERLPHYHT